MDMICIKPMNSWQPGGLLKNKFMERIPIILHCTENYLPNSLVVVNSLNLYHENLDFYLYTLNFKYESDIPNLNTIYIISDDTFSSLAIKEQILEDIKEFEKDTKIIFDNQIDISTLGQKINSLPLNSAVLFTSLYKDKNDKYITYSQIRDFFSSSKYPIFALNKIHLGEAHSSNYPYAYAKRMADIQIRAYRECSRQPTP